VSTGAKVTKVAGCCGLAGNFGVEIGHDEVSVAVAEQNLMPALDVAPNAIVVADGFSCRTQTDDLRSRRRCIWPRCSRAPSNHATNPDPRAPAGIPPLRTAPAGGL